MPCYRPVTVWKPYLGGPVVFRELKDHKEIKIKCGQCIGCRIDKREEWAVRCYAESKLHRENCFITLTYDDDHMPQYGSLNYKDFQLFMKRLRKAVGPLRFFAVGEYGEKCQRPHFHALLFGFNFPDRVKLNSMHSRNDLYGSEQLEALWGKGFVSIGELTYESARYCAVYTTKKVTGDKAKAHYSKLIPETGEIVDIAPEMARMSLNPGIGAKWLEKFWPDLYLTGNNAVFVNGMKKKIPKFFDDRMAEIKPMLMEEVKWERQKEVDTENNTRQRLEVREQVTLARERFTKERYR